MCCVYKSVQVRLQMQSSLLNRTRHNNDVNLEINVIISDNDSIFRGILLDLNYISNYFIVSIQFYFHKEISINIKISINIPLFLLLFKKRNYFNNSSTSTILTAIKGSSNETLLFKITRETKVKTFDIKKLIRQFLVTSKLLTTLRGRALKKHYYSKQSVKGRKSRLPQ